MIPVPQTSVGTVDKKNVGRRLSSRLFTELKFLYRS